MPQEPISHVSTIRTIKLSAQFDHYHINMQHDVTSRAQLIPYKHPILHPKTKVLLNDFNCDVWKPPKKRRPSQGQLSIRPIPRCSSNLVRQSTRETQITKVSLGNEEVHSKRLRWKTSRIILLIFQFNEHVLQGCSTELSLHGSNRTDTAFNYLPSSLCYL